ncbi:MAG: riboflavin synthase [Deltaproteobacteria bacterium]|nr:riboflavin synthase [Deltaproteobacteria bacterium]
MFTGIIEGTGVVRSITKRAESAQVEIQAQFDLDGMAVGESIAVNGCCLTITSRLGNIFWVDCSEETLRITTLGALRVGAWCNLERSLRYGGRVGGHLVQGHVDGIGEIVEIREREGSREFVFEIPRHLTRYIVEKGSIAVDGVSLTALDCVGNRCAVAVIPHTDCRTTFEQLAAGDSVNLEVDILGKYIEKLAFLHAEEYHAGTTVSREFLRRHGF